MKMMVMLGMTKLRSSSSAYRKLGLPGTSVGSLGLTRDRLHGSRRRLQHGRLGPRWAHPGRGDDSPLAQRRPPLELRCVRHAARQAASETTLRWSFGRFAISKKGKGACQRGGPTIQTMSGAASPRPTESGATEMSGIIKLCWPWGKWKATGETIRRMISRRPRRVVRLLNGETVVRDISCCAL